MLQRYADKAVSIAESATRGKIGDKLFAFSQYPAISERIRELTDEISAGIETAIVNGVEAQWTLSNNKNSELANVVFGVKSARNLPKAIQQRYYTTNENARHAFLARKNAGMSLSGRVWNLTEQFKEELELALDCGIRSGRSADELSRVVRRYLNNPTALFRRVRNEFGVLELSKRAKAYHPGQGVYRSAYKNARRLTATETNIAYRTSDFLRWQSFDFVVGIQIKLSNNHTLNGMPFVDICDDLAGFYPKWFKFTGWHPLCRCYAVPVFKSEKEMREDTERILSGMEPIAPSESTMAIKEYPSQLNKWIEKNKDRIHKAAAKGTLPYFIRDNQQIIGRYVVTDSNKSSFVLKKEVLKSDRFKTSDDIKFENLDTHILKRSGKSRKHFIEHCYNRSEIDAAEYIWEHPSNLKLVKPSPLGEVKDMSDPKAISNIEKKKARGVVSYNIYEFSYNNKTWLVKTEVLKSGKEQFYSITK